MTVTASSTRPRTPGTHAAGVMLLLLLAASCGSEKAAPVEPGAGSLEGSTYRSDYFGFTYSIPAGWSVSPSDAEERLLAIGASAVAGEDPVLKAAVEAAEPIQLLMVFQHPVGAAVDFNPSIVLVAESVAHAPGIVTGADYLFHAEKLLARSPMGYEPLGDVAKLDLDGHAFFRRDFLVAAQAGLRQSYLVAREGSYALAFVITAQDEATLDLLVGSLAQMDFD